MSQRRGALKVKQEPSQIKCPEHLQIQEVSRTSIPHPVNGEIDPARLRRRWRVIKGYISKHAYHLLWMNPHGTSEAFGLLHYGRKK